MAETAALGSRNALASFSAAGAAALVTYLADASLAVCRGTVFDATYFAYNAAATFLAFAVAALCAHLVRGGPLVALALCAGLEGLAFGGAIAGLTMAGGTALGLAVRDRMRSRSGAGITAPAGDGAIVGFAIAVTLILTIAAGGILGTHAPRFSVVIAGLVAVLMPLQLSAFGLYEALRPRIADLLGASPAPPWIVALGFLACFVLLPAIQRESVHLPEELRNGTGVDKPHVLILVLDTVRADRLGIYGYHRDTTPRLARRVATHPGAVVYPMAFSPSNWTAPAHASLFSGLYSFQHGVHRRGSTLYSYGNLPEGVPTIAEAMKSAGYRTAGIYANLMVHRVGGATRGFDVAMVVPRPRAWLFLGEQARRRWFEDFLASRIAFARAESVNGRVLRFLDECGAGPCFVIANYMDAHAPVRPRPPHAGMFEGAADGPDVPGQTSSDRYDEALRDLDERLDEFFVALSERGVLERSWVFITSDHGEGFGEHVSEHGHGKSIYNEEVRIPLVVLPPAGASPLPPREHPVSLVDVTATAAAVSGQPPLGVGRDLREPERPPSPIWSEVYSSKGPEVQRAVVYGQAKLVDRGSEERELYRLDLDPAEQDDRAPREPDRAMRLAEFLPASEDVVTASSSEQGSGEAPTQEEADALRALGYVE